MTTMTCAACSSRPLAACFIASQSFLARSSTCARAEEINGLDKRLAAIRVERGKLAAQRAMLEPWRPLDLPQPGLDRGGFLRQGPVLLGQPVQVLRRRAGPVPETPKPELREADLFDEASAQSARARAEALVHLGLCDLHTADLLKEPQKPVPVGGHGRQPETFPTTIGNKYFLKVVKIWHWKEFRR